MLVEKRILHFPSYLNLTFCSDCGYQEKSLAKNVPGHVLVGEEGNKGMKFKFTRTYISAVSCMSCLSWGSGITHLEGLCTCCVLFFWFLFGWLGLTLVGWLIWGVFLIFCGFLSFNFHQKKPLTIIKKIQSKPFFHFLSFCGWCSLNHAEFSFLLGRGSM